MNDELLHLVDLAELTHAYSLKLEALKTSSNLDEVQHAKVGVAVAHLSEAAKVLVKLARELQEQRGKE